MLHLKFTDKFNLLLKLLFKLAVDAYEVGVGAVLLQPDSSGINKPVAYFHKKLTEHQQGYSTVKKKKKKKH